VAFTGGITNPVAGASEAIWFRRDRSPE